MRPGVAAVMIAHNDEERALTRLLRDLLPALWLYRRVIEPELIVIDNSHQRLPRLAEAVLENGTFAAKYLWNEGRNLYYGPALNLAVKSSACPFLLYVCANHGRMQDPTWIGDLLEPLLKDSSHKVALTGSFYPSGPPSKLGFPDSLPWIHVQGGVFAARAQVLADHPYPEGQYAHWNSDVYQSLRLLQRGYRLVDVPTIKSVWRSRVQGNSWKFIHDES
jgi:hypothetical protein